MISSPYREITRPVIEYVRRLRRESPRDIVTVYVPEYVLGHWWEQALHNQSALRLKARLLLRARRRRRERALPARLGEAGVRPRPIRWQARGCWPAGKPLHAAEVRQEIKELPADERAAGPDRGLPGTGTSWTSRVRCVPSRCARAAAA